MATSTPGASAARPAALQTFRVPFVYEKFLYGGLACMAAACVTNPIDVVKVRLQLQGELQSRTTSRSGLIQVIIRVVKHEGIDGLYKGLIASLMREGSYSTLRMGLYDPIKDYLGGGSGHGLSFPLYKKILAGAIAGATGAAIANPTDLVKVRLQAEEKRGTRYRGTFHAFQSIYQKEGLAGLYRGVSPTTQRAMLLTASQLPSYDHFKHFLLSTPYFEEGLVTHFTASIFAGFVCATVTNPIDCIKSRYMNQPFGPDGRGVRYTSTLHCARKTVAAEGFLGLYKGWLPNWIRIGPHTIVTFLVFEQFRKWANIRAV